MIVNIFNIAITVNMILVNIGIITNMYAGPCVGTYAVPYVSTVPDITNMYNIFQMITNIGHRVGHQSGLDGSSREKSASF